MNVNKLVDSLNEGEISELIKILLIKENEYTRLDDFIKMILGDFRAGKIDFAVRTYNIFSAMLGKNAFYSPSGEPEIIYTNQLRKIHIYRLRNVGKTTLNEIVNIFYSYGLSLC